MSRKDLKRSYSVDELETAVEQIRTSELSYRQAESKYGIPRSTLYDHAAGRVTSCRRGPPTVLTHDEEKMLVDWTLHMADIGYGRTREQLCLTVKQILDKDKRETPFRDNYPGKDWWYAFLRRHPKLSVRMPESLQMCRASCATPEKLDKWYQEFSEFMKLHHLHDKPERIWNADESGFPLCPKTSRIVAMRNKKHVYSVNSDSKMQITTLVAASAGGNVVPPMHIFPGVRFRYNPLEGSVHGAYLGRSENGWMVTELFYGWLANHFTKFIPQDRPVLLLVDGHTTHIDIEISKYCKENGILLYCLPPHSSHLTQPLDVGFFGALKTNWRKAVDKFKISHMGSSVTKETFASVFKTAWTNTVKMSTIVNSFARAGIFPIDRNAVGKGGTLDPAILYSESTTDSSSLSSGSYESSTSGTLKSGASSSLEAIETVMDPSTIVKFNERYCEGYDIPGDEFYSVWEQLKKLSVSSTPVTVPSSSSVVTSSSLTVVTSSNSSIVSSSSSTVVVSSSSTVVISSSSVLPMTVKPSQAFSEILVYPQPIRKKKSQTRGAMPSHLNSSQIIQYMEEKRQKKADEEEDKVRKRAAREEKKIQREQEKREKKASREAKRKQLEMKRAQKKAEKESKKKDQLATRLSTRPRATQRKGRTTGRAKKTISTSEEESFAESESSSTGEAGDIERCPVCTGDDDDGDMVACDHCGQWYHLECSSIPPSSYDVIDSVHWMCDVCSTHV